MIVAGWAAAVVAAPAIGLAQTVAKPPTTAERPAGANGLKAYEAGAKAFEAGKYAPAIQSLSAALSAGGLSSQQMAKALYYRGVAYRKTGKSAQAISDLTSSVWLKNGLSDSDRAAAMDQRQGAYREAGLGAGPAIGAAPLDAPAAAAAPGPAPVAPAVAPAVSPAPAVAAAPTDAATSSWAATTAAGAAKASIPNLSQPASPPPPAAAVPAGGFATIATGEPDPPALSALPQGEATTAPAAAPLSGVGAAIGNAGTAVSNFFGGLMGGTGGSGATASPSDPMTTATTQPAAATVPPPPPPATGWNAATSVVEGKPKKVAAAAEKPRAAKAGTYHLQVGVLRSRAEAEQLAANLKAKHGAALGSVGPAIDEVVYGNMGTFYRVQVGPYASAAEPGDFCSTLKPQGYDCLVITQ